MIEEYLKVPKDRIAVIIGLHGETKKGIERATKTSIEVDSESGDIDVKSDAGNALNFYIALNIIKAIARGFSPEHAFLLKEKDNYLEIIDLSELLGKSEKLIKQKKGRVIGREGRVREEIERSTGALISVYGKTISIIGGLEEIEKAKKAIELLLEGASHDRAKKFLRKESFKKFEL
ncbi:MAG: KH domain-containing protein [Candidatus Diapherotrites archaeon]